MEDKHIIVSVLFKNSSESTDDESGDEVKSFAKRFGVKVVSSAKKTACLSMSLQAFENLFDRAPDIIKEKPPSERDFGTPEGFSSAELPIPKELDGYVELLAVEPPASRLTAPAQLGPIYSVSPGADDHGKKKEKVDKPKSGKQKDAETKEG